MFEILRIGDVCGVQEVGAARVTRPVVGLARRVAAGAGVCKMQARAQRNGGD